MSLQNDKTRQLSIEQENAIDHLLQFDNGDPKISLAAASMFCRASTSG
jgi:hypothetical protein